MNPKRESIICTLYEARAQAMQKWVYLYVSLAVSTMLSIPSDISNEQQASLDKLKVTLEEVHQLERSTQQQSSSVKWQTSRIGRITSHFGDVLLWKSALLQHL